MRCDCEDTGFGYAGLDDLSPDDRAATERLARTAYLHGLTGVPVDRIPLIADDLDDEFCAHGLPR